MAWRFDFPGEPPVPRTAWRVTGYLFAGLGLAAAVVLVPFQRSIWDGGVTSAEYRLTFVDETGGPVPGVTLKIETEAGGVCYLYPVDEFVPDQAVTSGADGRM